MPSMDAERGARMVDITCMATTPPTIRGITNVAGPIVPVIDVRRHFGLAAGKSPRATICSSRERRHSDFFVFLTACQK
ncbi:chemotaxis protein CheW [Burkholderia ubonensis]|uniref:chemotaxis protein CheW n=1 Tax=Burkholderia TaxID=32008 RepID=UPI0039F56DA6